MMQKALPLISLEEKDQSYIASFLDSDQKWAKVANELSVSSQNIGWIKNRNHPRGSSTLILLEDLSLEEKSLEDFMEAVKRCNVRPVDDYLSQRYPVIKENFSKRSSHVATPTSSSSSNCSKQFISPTYHHHHHHHHHHPIDLAFLMLPNVFLVYCSTEGLDDLSSLVQFLASNNIVPRFGVPEEGERNKDFNISPHNLVTRKQFENLKCPVLVLVTPNLGQDIENLDCSLTTHGNQKHHQIPGKENRTIHDSSDPPLSCKEALKLATDKGYRKQYSKRFLIVLCKNAKPENIPRWLKNSNVYHWDIARVQLLYQVCSLEKKLSPKSN